MTREQLIEIFNNYKPLALADTKELAELIRVSLDKAYRDKGHDPSKRTPEERKSTRDTIMKFLSTAPLNTMRMPEVRQVIEEGYLGLLGKEYIMVSSENTLKILKEWYHSEARKAAWNEWNKTRKDLLGEDDEEKQRKMKDERNAEARRQAWEICKEQVKAKSEDLEHWAWRLAFRYLHIEEGFSIDPDIRDMYQARAEDIVKDELKKMADSQIVDKDTRAAKDRGMKLLAEMFDGQIQDKELKDHIDLIRRKLVARDYIRELVFDIPESAKILSNQKQKTQTV